MTDRRGDGRWIAPSKGGYSASADRRTRSGAQREVVRTPPKLPSSASRPTGDLIHVLARPAKGRPE